MAAGDDLDGERKKRLAPEAAFREPCGSFWVFGYGSLMWRPGFDYVDRREAALRGYARDFCLWSLRYRGTPEAPGLVLGLRADPGACVHGIAFRVGPDNAEEARAYLLEREMVTASYRETVVALKPICPGPSETITAITYVVDRTHPQYAGGLSVEEQARIIATRRGPVGSNCEYLFNTLEEMRAAGLPSEDVTHFDALAARVRALQAEDR